MNKDEIKKTNAKVNELAFELVTLDIKSDFERIEAIRAQILFNMLSLCTPVKDRQNDTIVDGIAIFGKVRKCDDYDIFYKAIVRLCEYDKKMNAGVIIPQKGKTAEQLL